MTKVLALWSGDLDLNEAFWTWTGTGTGTVGLLVNIAISILFLVLILEDQPLAAVLVGYGLSVPYNIVLRPLGSGRRPCATAIRRATRIWHASRASF